MEPLLTPDQAAKTLGVPVASLRGAAERHGFLIRIGRSVRIDPNDLKEIVKRCREHPHVNGGVIMYRRGGAKMYQEPRR